MYWREKRESHKPNDNPWLRPYYRPRSADIEITAYALLAYSLERDVTVALAISRWLSQQRNSLGGYSSTQVLCWSSLELADCFHNLEKPEFSDSASRCSLASFRLFLNRNSRSSLAVLKDDGLLKLVEV